MENFTSCYDVQRQLLWWPVNDLMVMMMLVVVVVEQETTQRMNETAAIKGHKYFGVKRNEQTLLISYFLSPNDNDSYYKSRGQMMTSGWAAF